MRDDDDDSPQRALVVSDAVPSGYLRTADGGVQLIPERRVTQVRGRVHLASRPELWDEYLHALAETGRYGAAAAAVGCHYNSAYKLRNENKEFATLCDEALELYRGRVAAEIHRRAIDGVDEPVYWQGQLVGYKRVYSDTLLLAHARARIPEYRDSGPGGRTTVNVSATATATAGAQAAVPTLDTRAMTREQRDALRVLVRTTQSALPSGAQDSALPSTDPVTHDVDAIEASHAATDEPECP